MDPFPGVKGAPQTQHPYLYGLNNPTRYTDPSGESVLLAASLYGVGYFAYDYIDRYTFKGDNKAWSFLGYVFGYESIQQDLSKIVDPCVPFWRKAWAVADLALNAAFGITMFMGFIQAYKGFKMAWAMRNMTAAQRLRYLHQAGALSRISVRPGRDFFRPPGYRQVWINANRLDDVLSLAGGFTHEVAHVGQAFGKWGFIARPFQWLSAATTKIHPMLAFFPPYAFNPVEIHAAATGVVSLHNAAWLAIKGVWSWSITNLPNLWEESQCTGDG